MGNIIKAEELPEHEKVYMKKDMFGWRVVQPIRNEDGSINVVNILFGGWRNFLFLLCILLIIGFLMWTHSHDIKAIQENYGKIASNPIEWCKDICEGDFSTTPYVINITEASQLLSGSDDV